MSTVNPIFGAASVATRVLLPCVWRGRPTRAYVKGATEVVALTLDFYRRHCIEGLFLSSGIIRSPDYTMEQVVEVARCLREDLDFRRYIHLKSIPDASPELLEKAGRFADRLSINIELRPCRVSPSSRPRRTGSIESVDGIHQSI